eukprot:scaffold1640_cov161-Amphora_coffeaeformis.AAC.46
MEASSDRKPRSSFGSRRGTLYANKYNTARHTTRPPHRVVARSIGNKQIYYYMQLQLLMRWQSCPNIWSFFIKFRCTPISLPSDR